MKGNTSGISYYLCDNTYIIHKTFQQRLKNKN